MKDKICKEKGCMNRISSKMNKSGLCGRCNTKKYKREHDSGVKKYHQNYWIENKGRLQPGNDETLKKWRKENPERMKEWGSDYYDKHKKKIKAYGKNHYENNKEAKIEYTRIYQNKRYREDEGFRMRKKLGGALWKVIDCYIKTGKVINPCKKYGIDWEGIIKVLSPIPKERYKYHVDHIIPLCKFDLTNIEQIQLAFEPKNHRWLLAKENLGRSRKE